MSKAFCFRVFLITALLCFMVFLVDRTVRSQGQETLQMRVSSSVSEMPIGNTEAAYWQRREFANYSEYVEEMQTVLKSVWAPPKRDKSYQVLLKFRVDKSGKVTQVRVAKTSGDPELDAAALSALRQSMPFAPLPETEADDSVTIEFSFDYNAKGTMKAESMDRAVRSYKVYISTDTEAIPDFKQSDFRAFTEEAMQEWTRVSKGQAQFTVTNNPKEANLWVTWTPEFSNPGALGYTRCNAEHTKCWIQVRSMYRPGGEIVMKDSFTRLTLLHEVGHVLGLGHSRNSDDIMCTGEHGDSCSQMSDAVKRSDYVPQITESDRQALASKFSGLTQQANSGASASYNTLGNILNE